MSKFLLTVCAFGLLLSPAFAEDKTPERLREENSYIFGHDGLQKHVFTRVVPSETNQRIGFFNAVNPDCSASGVVNVRATKQPKHGTVEITTATNFPSYPKESIRYKGNQHKVKGMQVNYKSAEKYIGLLRYCGVRVLDGGAVGIEIAKIIEGALFPCGDMAREFGCFQPRGLLLFRPFLRECR